MNELWFWGLIAAFFFWKFIFGAKPDIDSGRARELLSAGARLIDVRSPAEFSGHRLPGAVNIPLGLLDTRLPELLKGGPVIFYCASGMRSAQAAKALRRAGRPEDVYNLGGIGRW